MSKEAMRAEFEAWCCEADDGPQVDPMWMAHFDPATNEYALDQIQRDWRTWQASREALVIELPFVRMYPPNEASSDVDYWIDEAKANMHYACRTAIEATGARVK